MSTYVWSLNIINPMFHFRTKNETRYLRFSSQGVVLAWLVSCVQEQWLSLCSAPCGSLYLAKPSTGHPNVRRPWYFLILLGDVYACVVCFHMLDVWSLNIKTPTFHFGTKNETRYLRFSSQGVVLAWLVSSCV